MTTDAMPEGGTVKTEGAVSFMAKLRTIAALDAGLVTRLAEIEIVDNVGLLERGAMPEGRDQICAAAGVDPVQLLQALYLMDLERVDGVSWNSASLLAAAGVATVPDLAFRNAEDLLPQLQRANQELGLLKRLPAARSVKGWIEHARSLPQVIFFGGNAEVY